MAASTPKTGVFKLRKRDLVVVVMTTLILVGVVALIAALSLRQGLPNGIANATPKKVPVHVVWVQPDRSIPVVVGPALPPGETITEHVPTEAEAQEAPPSASPSLSRPMSAPASGWSDFIGRIIAVVACIFAVAVVAPLVFAVCFFTLLRRHSERFGALIQINNAIATPVGTAPSFATGHAILPAKSSTTDNGGYPLTNEIPSQVGGALFEHLFAETLELQVQLDQVSS
jgi:hypothetical protein